MHKLWAVIRREFQARVQTKAFVIGTVLGPVIMAFMVVLPVILNNRETEAKHIVVIDAASGQFGLKLERALAEARRGGGPQAIAKYAVTRVTATGRLKEVRDSLVRLTGLARDTVHRVDGLLIATDEALESGNVQYLGANVGSLSEMSMLGNIVEQQLLTERLERKGVDPVLVHEAQGHVDLKTSKITEGKETGESGGASFALAYVMSFLLYFSMLIYGIQVMSSVIEEKTNRIMEVLASSLTPFQLMAGKVIGVGAVGLLQLGIWVGTAMFLSANAVMIGGWFNMPPEAASQMPLPAISPSLLIVFLAFFLVGFFLFAAAYAAVGAMCNTMQEAQQYSTVLTLLVAASFISALSLFNEPSGALARTLSMVPFFAPIIMPVRYSLTSISWVEVLTSFTITFLGMLGVAWLAGRIYRIGILMYGKKPSFRELAHWIRAA
ncbi:MAG: ABC transporter permease [Gemmatimonadota bacterium]